MSGLRISCFFAVCNYTRIFILVENNVLQRCFEENQSQDKTSKSTELFNEDSDDSVQDPDFSISSDTAADEGKING